MTHGMMRLGTLRGNSLAVEYQESLQHTDFENAVYVLMR